MSQNAYDRGFTAGLKGKQAPMNPYNRTQNRHDFYEGFKHGRERFLTNTKPKGKGKVMSAQAFSEENSGKILLCFFDAFGDWHIEYFGDVRTLALNLPNTADRKYYINQWEVGVEQFKMLLDSLNTLADGVMPISDILEDIGT